MARPKTILTSILVLVCSLTTNAELILMVNGLDASNKPLDLKRTGQIKIGVYYQTELKEQKYDLTIRALGGSLQQESYSAAEQATDSNEIHIETDDLNSVDDILFSFGSSPGLGSIELITNAEIDINGIEVSAGTKIYELVLFDIEEEDTIFVFGIGYEALNYSVPEQQLSSQQASLGSQTSEARGMDSGGESQMMMSSSGWEEQETVWFSNPAQCPDLDDTNFVDFRDFSILAGNWLKVDSNLAGDFDENGTVDFNDLDHLTTYWLMPVDCPEYYADTLPYLTSFEYYQGFEAGYSLDYQKGWQVINGFAAVVYDDYDPCFPYQYVVFGADALISKSFVRDDANDNYIRLDISAEYGAVVSILQDSNVVASVEFNANDNIFILNNGSYVDTGVYWDYGFTELKFVMDYDNDTYTVYWDESSIGNANFDNDYDGLDEVRVENSDYYYMWLNRISVSNESGSGGEVDEEGDIYITWPCACSDDELEGRVPITGKVWWDRLGIYEIMFCPADLDYTDIDNWHTACSGENVVPDGGILGYWDTSQIPNGHYYLGIAVYNDRGYSEEPFSMMFKDIYLDETFLGSMPAYYVIAGDLKVNTFSHQEQPDIQVSWPGQYPFKFQRFYNNNRRFYSEPLRNGWSTYYSDMKITEITTDDNCSIAGTGLPEYDGSNLGFGEILVTYPDGSKGVFVYYGGNTNQSTVTYESKYPDRNGDRIERTTHYTTEDFMEYYDARWTGYCVDRIDYELIMRDGTRVLFDNADYFEVSGIGQREHIPVYGTSYNGGMVGWMAIGGVSSITDRFENTLDFDWYTDDQKPVALRQIEYADNNTEIYFTRSSGYYTKVELKVDSQVQRTVEFEWDSNNRIYTVTRKGYGVDANGIYDGSNLKEYDTLYQYDSGMNLVKIAYSGNLSEPSIEIEYDEYGRIDTRTDYVDPGNYLSTYFTYEQYHPIPGNENISYLRTEAITPYRFTTTIQDQKGNMLEQKTLTADGATVIDVNTYYNDTSNPAKATDTNEFFDGKMRRSWNDYDGYGNLLEQKIYLDDVNYTATEFEYHPDLSLHTSQKSWQDVNKTGPVSLKLSIYGDADGTENTNGDYLVKEKVLLEEDPNVWAITSYEYYDNGLVKKKTDPNGFITFYEYDAKGFVKLMKIGTSDSNSPIQRFYNDVIGQRRIQSNHLGGVVLNDYDKFGKLWRIRKYSDSSAMTRSDATFIPSTYEGMSPISTTIYGYDAQGNRTYEQKCDCGGGQIHTDYTVSGLSKQISYDDGSYLRNYYDARGLKIEEYRYDANTTQDWWVVNGYDCMDRRVQTIWYDYDDSNAVKAEVMSYYGSGKVKYQDIYGYGLYIEKQTDYEYDISGRLTKRVVAPGSLNLTTQYDYDAAGNRISITDPNGNIVYIDYDNANRKIAETFATDPDTEPNQAVIKEEIWYYENGFVKDVKHYDYDDSLLSHSKFEYDARGRVIEVIQDINEAEQAQTSYEYSDTGFGTGNEYHIKITDAANNVTWRALCPFERIIKVLHPSGDYEELEYNGDCTIARRAVWEPNDTKRWIEYYYDSYSRLTDVDYPDGGNVHYTYDGFDRKILVEDNRNSTDNIGGTEQIAYQYDVLDRIVNITEHDDYEIEYSYQADGQKQMIKVYEPNDSLIYNVEYLYDPAGRLWTVSEPLLGLDGYIAEFQYDLKGNRSQLSYYKTGNPLGATIEVNYEYDRDNHLKGYTTSGGPTFILEDTVTDGLDRLWDANETVTGTDGDPIDHSYTYEYDMLSRMTYAYTTNVAPTPAREFRYWYDKAGNVTHRMFNNYNPDYESYKYYTYDGFLQTVSGGKDITYNLNGWQTSLPADNPADYPIEYDWDGRVRWHKHLSTDLGMNAKYTPDGLRIWKKHRWNLGTYEHKFIVDPTGNVPNILLVLDANDNNEILKTYIHAHDQIICQHDGDYNADRYFYLADRRNSVRQIVDASGDVVNCYYYSPWGTITGSESDEAIDNWYTFAGYYFEDSIFTAFSETYYCNARYYRGGRFFTRDPIRGDLKEPMSLHPYLYCMDDPINRTDPSGALWGAVRRSSRTVYGVSAYYVGLAIGLQFATSPWDIMDVAISANKFRESYFAPENLNRPFAWELAMREGVGGVIDKIANACDYDELAKCLGKKVGLKIAEKGAIHVVGISLCTLCFGDVVIPDPIPLLDEGVLCGGCSIYSIYLAVNENPVVSILSKIKDVQDIGACFFENCGN